MLTFLALLAPAVYAASANALPLPRHGTVGLQLRALPDDVRQRMRLGPQEALEVAANANGLRKGDIVLAVRGKRFKSFADYSDLLRAETLKPKASLTISRSGRELNVEVAVQPKPIDATDDYATIYDEVASNGHRIRTLVTRPKSSGKHPVFFYVQGINLGSVDIPLTGKGYIASLLRGFATDFVTVRIEKTGVGDSEGGPAKLVGFDEELDIYRQALKSLTKYDFVDQSNIFVFGHSMGGCHAPLICSEIPVRGIVTYGTVANSWLEWEIRSPRIQGPLAGKSRAETDAELRLLVGFYHYVYNEKRSIGWIKRNRPELRKLAEEQSPDNLMLGDRTVKFMQEVNDHNFCEAWTKLGSTRVLALFGETDWISLKEDQTTVADAVNAAQFGNAKFDIVPSSDHVFYRSTSMKDDYDRFGKPGMEFNPEVIKVVRAWIDSLRTADLPRPGKASF